jgi:hypothetical protein
MPMMILSLVAALERSGVTPDVVEEVFMGHVLSGNTGQAPARQAAQIAGLPAHVPCTSVNKVCASGMKAIMIACQSILLGQRDVVIAGGMESMTHAPHMSNHMRRHEPRGPRQRPFVGDMTLRDSLQRDGYCCVRACSGQCHDKDVVVVVVDDDDDDDDDMGNNLLVKLDYDVHVYIFVSRTVVRAA